jgi:hypothetical protein
MSTAEANNIQSAKEKTIKALKTAQATDHIAAGHALADDALCFFLAQIGYQDVVKEYQKVNRRHD